MGDPYWYYKVLGLHCDGTNGSTTFTDTGPSPKTVTAAGNAQISTAQYPALTGKTSSGLLDGTGDYLSAANSSDFDFGSGDFTIRFLLKTASTGVILMGKRPNASWGPFVLGITAGGKLQVRLGTGSGSFAVDISSTDSINGNVWTPIELTRASGTVRMFVDGNVQSTTASLASALYVVTDPVYIGANGDGTASVNGYISEVEIYKGIALHTANYTPPTTPFPDEYVSVSGTVKDSSNNFASRLVRVYRRDTGAFVAETVSNHATGAWKVTPPNSGTVVPVKHVAVCHDSSVFAHYRVLGLHCDGTNGSTTFTDTTGKGVTAVGNAQISTAQYPALTGKTSSGYLDGAGDYLTVPDSADWAFGSGNFTLRARIRLAAYATSNSGQYQSCVISQDSSVSGSRAFTLNVIGTVSSFTTLTFTGFSSDSTYTSVTGSYTFSLDTWYLVEACRVGNLVYLLVNGTLLNTGGTAFSQTLQNSSTTLKVGAEEYDATYKYYLNGYISEVEVFKGVGLHNASYTPDTVPFYDSTESENALIFDDITPA